MHNNPSSKAEVDPFFFLVVLAIYLRSQLQSLRQAILYNGVSPYTWWVHIMFKFAVVRSQQPSNYQEATVCCLFEVGTTVYLELRKSENISSQKSFCFCHIIARHLTEKSPELLSYRWKRSLGPVTLPCTYIHSRGSTKILVMASLVHVHENVAK